MGIMYMKHVKFFVFLCILTFTVSCGQQKKYVQYKVKEGETMRGIAQRLDMKTKDLLRLNPDVGRNPGVNSVIVIPNKKIKAETTTKGSKADEVVKTTADKASALKDKKDKDIAALKKNFVVYEVKKGDTFYSLTRFYNVTQEELITLNPVLSEGLKVGQVIKIKGIEEGEEVLENHIYEDVIEEDISLKVALLLPFKAQEYNTVDAKDIFQKSKLANMVTDFYLGAKIAVDSIRKQGIQVDLNVFDTQKNGTEIRTILAQNDLNKNDVIIGPLYSEEAEIVAHKVKVPVVFPFYSTKQSKFSASSLIKTSPEKKVFREELTSYIKENFTKGNLILVGDGKADSNISNAVIKQSLQSHDSISVVHILKPTKGYIAKKRFLEILKPNEDNWIILTSGNTVLVADAINSLISLPEKTSVQVFTFNKGAAFDKIANLKLAKINLTYVSDEYVNEASASTQLFNKQYFSKNNAMPSFYATKGFDITYDILIRLASGDDLKNTFKEGASFRIESKFDYTDKSTGISENKGLFIVKYNNDLSLTRLK
ncbi:LysM peptidoglycan-binding domain-containing protein [Polaribacter sp. Q13]|uniref:PBP1 and LysM peptidoglycan-binding domain-containing protein n=1 Tax=Polaribacter sp. Q13 TaxID=2806551 RepID=UPI00193BC26B|nr:LysM peptidoglycan-binding domain-containing protein [Polaribacter sp. Q13]QVY67307.1 LysM peptidoglycan-binding domain-containing protein [Polaribacter sp. Q13]